MIFASGIQFCLRDLLILKVIICLFLGMFMFCSTQTTLLVVAIAPFVLMGVGIFAKKRGALIFGTLVLAVIISPIGFSGLTVWVMTAHGVSLSKLERLCINMDKVTVIEILGEPSHVQREVDGSETWTYDRQTWCQVLIFFGQDGKVSVWHHDH